MATIAITAENFEQQVEREGILLIDWWAPWCGPCRTFGPVYEEASERHADLTFGKVNTDEQQQLAGAFQIQSIPTLMVFRDRVMVFARPGALPPSALDSLITQVRGLDMVEVHREIEKSNKEAKEEATTRETAGQE